MKYVENSEKRIKLIKGKQKELLHEAKSKAKFSWSELAAYLNISSGYLRNELRKEVWTLREDLYRKLVKLAGQNYDTEIEKMLESNWGQIKGGKNSYSQPKKSRLLITEPNETLAELIGIMLGDGNMYEMKEKSIYQTRVFGHKVDDWDYITKWVSNIFEKLFDITPQINYLKDVQVVILFKQSKHLNFTLKHFGLKPGNKVTNNASIPQWVFDNKKYLEACIRGLIDTDGSICPKTKRHKTPSIWFCNASPNIRRDFNKALKILGYSVSKWVVKKNRNSQDCSIGNANAVWRYYKEIGFSNPKHKKRFEMFWKKAPMV
ncbi:MAG: LAGLIDADG family homing endonuclease [archaeon]